MLIHKIEFKSIFGWTIKNKESSIRDYIMYESIEIKHFEIPNIFKIWEQWQIKGKLTERFYRKLNESEWAEINSFLNKNTINKFTFTSDEYDFHLSKDEDK